MPYIEKKDRPFYDALANTISIKFLNGYDDFEAELKTFITHINVREEKKQDGDFNYFLFKIAHMLGYIGQFLFFNASEDSKKVQKFIYDFVVAYSEPESYYRYNRIIGMLTSCRYEMLRRGNRKDFWFSGYKEFAKILEEVATDLYWKRTGSYEERKRITNGDIF